MDLHTFFHGTDINSAIDFLNGVLLDPVAAARGKVDGPPGFFLAATKADAEFFAVRRGGAVLEYNLTDVALAGLLGAGCLVRPIPVGRRSPGFVDDELYIPPTAFGDFNRLRQAGEIDVYPTA